MARDSAPSSPLDRAWLAGTAALPAFVATGGLGLYADGGRDGHVVQTAGFGFTGPSGAADAWLAAPFALLPIGTRVLRAELPGVVLLGLVGALTFALVRRLLLAVAGPSRWVSVVAAVASASVSLSLPFQREAWSVGSSLGGVALVLLALLLAGTAGVARPVVAAVVGLAFASDLTLGACAVVAALAARTAVGGAGDEGDEGEPEGGPRGALLYLLTAAGFVAGLTPLVLTAVRARVTPLAAGVRGLATWTRLDAGHETGFRHVHAAFDAELGELLLVLAAAGLLWGLVTRRPGARRSTASLALVTAIALGVAVERGVRASGDDTWRPATLVGLAGVVMLAAVAMHEAVLRVARAKLPLAGASAAMVVVLELAFPAVILDDGLARASKRPREAAPAWEDAAFAGLPGGSLLLVATPRLYDRLLAARAAGAVPGDLQVLPTFDPTNEAAASALAHDDRLVPLFRDLALTGTPVELSLSTLAGARPLALATDPRWDRTLTRHLVPAGLLSMFEPEPRGGSDRKRALEAQSPGRARLVAAIGPKPEASPLASLTLALLFDRALAAVQTGEREVALRAIEDAAAFGPKDPRIQRLTLRVLNAKGPVDVRDMAREGLAASER